MRPVSANYLRSITGPVRRLAEVTVTLPGETTPTELAIETDDSTVTMDGSSNIRYSASISLSPDTKRDVFALAGTPGAEFRIRAGVVYGRGLNEWVDCGVLYAAEGSRGITVGDFQLTLQDGASRLEECRFPSPWTAEDGQRAANIEALILDASPDVTVRNLAAPNLMAGVVFERDRLDAINTIATGGTLDAAFDASGDWVNRDSPLITPAAPTWIVRTGKMGTILDGAERQIPLARLYNMVVVLAPESFQTWGAVTFQIADDSNARHWSKIGKRPFFVTDSTITSLAQAQARAKSTMQRLLRVTEDILVPTLGNAALEYGDTLAVIHERTQTDPGLAANYLTEGWTFNLGTGEQDITGRSTDQPVIEEV